MVKYTFKDLCSIKTGKLDANAAVENGAYPFFTCSKEPLKIDTYAYDCDCILLAGNGEFNVNIYSGKFNAYQRTYIIQVNDSGKTSLKYLFYLLKYNVAHLKNVCTGGVIKFIKLGNIQSITVPEADIKIQQKISIELDRLQNAIDLKKQQLSSLDDLVKSRFIEMFGDPVENPKGWDKRPLSDECEIITGNTPSRKKPNYYGDFIEWIKSDNINTPNALLTPAAESLSEEGLKVGRSVEKDCILMTCIAGSLGCIGNVSVTDRKVAFNQQINGIIPNKNNVWFLYVLFDLSKSYIQSTVTMALKGILSKGQLSKIEFIFPPIELQNEFAEFVKLIDKSKFVCQSNPSIFCVKFLRFRHPP